jgi:hypothetical protein
MSTIFYKRSSGVLELVISRYPDPQSLDKHWKELSAKFDTNAVAPKVGQSAAWLHMGAQAPGRVLVFRQGLFMGWADTAPGIPASLPVSGEPLMDLVKVTAGKMAKVAEPTASPKAAPPHR